MSEKVKRQSPKKTDELKNPVIEFWSYKLALETIFIIWAIWIAPLVASIISMMGQAFFGSNDVDINRIVFVIGALIFLTGVIIIMSLAKSFGFAVFGMTIGSGYARLLLFLRRFSFSPLQSPHHYRRFAYSFVAISTALLYALLFKEVTSPSVTPDVQMPVYMVLWCVFSIMFVAWRLLRLHHRFIRFYFGDERKQKMV